MSYSLPCGLRRADIRGIAAAVSPQRIVATFNSKRVGTPNRVRPI